MGSQDSLAFIIPAYNEEILLPSTLEAVFKIKEQLPNYYSRVIVVDNNSTDSTSLVALNNGAEVIFEPHNQISKARNAGAKACPEVDFLFFIDADTAPTIDVVKNALEVLKRGTYCGGGCMVKFSKPSLFVNFWSIITRLTNMAAGAFIFCTNEAFKGSGGYNEEIYAAEDVIFSRAVNKWGKKNGCKGFTILQNTPS